MGKLHLNYTGIHRLRCIIYNFREIDNNVIPYDVFRHPAPADLTWGIVYENSVEQDFLDTLFLRPVSPIRADILKAGLTTWLGWLRGLEEGLPALLASFPRFLPWRSPGSLNWKVSWRAQSALSFLYPGWREVSLSIFLTLFYLAHPLVSPLQSVSSPRVT